LAFLSSRINLLIVKTAATITPMVRMILEHLRFHSDQGSAHGLKLGEHIDPSGLPLGAIIRD